MTQIKFTLMFLALFIMLLPMVAHAEPVPLPMGDGSIIVVDDTASAVPMPEGATFLQQVWLTVQPVLLLFIAGVVTRFFPLLMSALVKWMQSKVHSASFNCAMDKINQHATAAVLDVAQTYVAEVRRSGKWDGTAAATAKAKAQEKLAALMGPAGLAEARSCLGQTEVGLAEVMNSAIESALVRAKVLMGLPPASASPAPTVDPSAGQPAGSGASAK